MSLNISINNLRIRIDKFQFENLIKNNYFSESLTTEEDTLKYLIILEKTTEPNCSFEKNIIKISLPKEDLKAILNKKDGITYSIQNRFNLTFQIDIKRKLNPK